jgi:signal peptidase II
MDNPVGKFFKDTWRDYLFLLLVGGALIGLDQWTKALVRSNISFGQDWIPSWLAWLAPFARINHSSNTGAAFSFFQNGNLVFTIVATVAACLIIYYFPRVFKYDRWLRLAMAMMFAGAVGNLIDRLLFRRVTDFILVNHFAVFNVADASLSVGVAIMVLSLWLKEQAEKKKAVTVSTESQAKDG